MSSNARSTFFRQSGWMFFATLLGGAFMFAVHPAYFPFLGEKAYGEFQAVLALLNVMVIPSIGLQTIFAQQTAAAASDDERDRLIVAVQTLLRWTFFLWLTMTVLVFVFHSQILERLKLPGLAALAITVGLGLGQLWTPILNGVLQGRQNFLWLGWASIVNSLGRFFSIGIIVIWLHGGATGAAFGALFGTFAMIAILFIQSRDVWMRPKPPAIFAAREWLMKLIPLTFGLGAYQFLFSVDYLVVRDLFGENHTGSYAIAGMLGRGVVLFTAPVSAVMFPKVVHSFSQRTKTNVLAYAFLSTLFLGVIAAAACTGGAILLKHWLAEPTSMPTFLVAKLKANWEMREALKIMADLLPWFVWGMLPLAVANVLLNNLLARRRSQIVFYLVAIVVAYTICLRAFGSSFLRVAQILCVFNVIFLGALSLFTWLDQRRTG